ncbi:substrate-binding periplasmic protein [Ferruginivarius sediminum]|uniref:ABC transporter n=1 Tax=Ferruginivarius sediminum TaxID=2661937 RepID=A0A369TER3_9PROT|nr:transporter substrate-binding domain-containing protein [Ferruginivarius sediminum]RDD63851.1 ABC transporter [Ferruginivarius sediminum]
MEPRPKGLDMRRYIETIRNGIRHTRACSLRLIAGFVVLYGLAANAAADGAPSPGSVIRLSTLNWPPYTNRDLPEGGASSAIVRAIFAKAGYPVEIRFWPWNRAIAKAKSGAQDVVAYFPGYHCHHDPNSDFIASDPMGTAPLGFAEHVMATHAWGDLDDLARLRIGTVVGYANTKKFDARARNGDLRIIKSHNDKVNLLKLLQRQIDYAVIDKYVMQYLLKTDATLRQHRDSLRFDKKELELKDLYLCFRNDEKGRALRRTFNRGLKTIEAEDMLQTYVEKLVQE